MNGRTEILQNLIGSTLEVHPDVLDEIKDLSTSFPDDTLPYLDKNNVNYDDLNDLQKSWRRDGVVILENFIPDSLIDNYREDWIQHNMKNHNRPSGYPGECPYFQVPTLMDICTYKPLAEVLELLIGEPMGVHLNLTGWKSTQRNWHQDGYLNPDTNKDHYLAVWVALNDIHPDSGPFEFVRGTHMLPIITQGNTLARLTAEEAADPMWPKYSERFLTPMFESILDKANLQKEQFIAKRGDVLIWHARLMHRGTIPNNPDLWRETAILHYSGIHHRPDMPKAVQKLNNGWYFPIDQRIPL